VGKNTHHMMQRELIKKDDVIQKLTSDTNTKACDSIKNELKAFLAEKIEEMEGKTRNMIKEEIKHTTEIMMETSKRTYAEITSQHKEELSSATEQKRVENIEKENIESRKLNIIIHGLHEYSDKADEVKMKMFDENEISELLEDINVSSINFSH